MTDLIRAAFSARWLSGATVFLVAWMVGAKAATGLSPLQILGSALALGGAIAWAVIEQVWPRPARAGQAAK